MTEFYIFLMSFLLLNCDHSEKKESKDLDTSSKHERKSEKIDWKKVSIIKTIPHACEKIGQVEGGSVRLFFTVSNKTVRNSAYKSLMKDAAKLGGNSVYLEGSNVDMLTGDAVGTAFWCDPQPISEVEIEF